MAERLKKSQQELDGLNRDLSRRMEEKTREVTEHMRTLELAERLAALGKVASGVAHEINNPLGIIINRIECIEADAGQLGVPPDLARDLQAIRLQAERILRVTRSMLSLSSGTAPTFKAIEVACVIRSCLAISSERMGARDVRLLSDCEPDACPVMGDRDRLETVILNLLNNAIDAVQNVTGRERRVDIHCRTVKQNGETWITVTVEDNGPGIPSKLKNRIFEPFFTTKPTGEGHGLGLFLCHTIVSEHRGRIDVAETGAGTAVTVWLPAWPGAETRLQEQTWSQQEKFSS
jgi:two-component system NtrC family sensor kinase